MWRHTNYITNIPAKEWRVVPAITEAAAPVLAVATVTSGGKAPIIFRSRKDLPVPALPKQTTIHSQLLHLIHKNLHHT